MRAAVLGTGIMGAAMARSLAREGHEVAVWNRTRARADEAAGDSITAYGTVREAVSGADLVITALFDADNVIAVADDVVAADGPGDAHAGQSTSRRAGAHRPVGMNW